MPATSSHEMICVSSCLKAITGKIISVKRLLLSKVQSDKDLCYAEFSAAHAHSMCDAHMLQVLYACLQERWHCWHNTHSYADCARLVKLLLETR
jgi:hypothetical protein